MDASYSINAAPIDETTIDETKIGTTSTDLAELGRAPRRAAYWSLALIVTTLAFNHWPTISLDIAIVYLVMSPLAWHRLARRARVGAVIAELFVTPLVLIGSGMNVVLITAAVYGLLLGRIVMHGAAQWRRATEALFAGIACGALLASMMSATTGINALSSVSAWHVVLVVAWSWGFGFAVALLSYLQGRRSTAARERLAQKSRVLELLAVRLGRYLSPQVQANLFAEVAKTAANEIDRGGDHTMPKGFLRVRSQDAASGMTGRIVSEKHEDVAHYRQQPHRRWLTVFFSDVVGFTALTEALAPEEVAHLLNAYLDAMATIALAHGGTIDKFIGDALMVFFGDPDTQGRDADAMACTLMAQSMQTRIKKLEVHARSIGVSEPLRVRMGIASGMCTVGDFGAEHRLDYTALGSAVNLASRLEGAAAPGGILISASTAALLDDTIQLRPVGPLCLAGLAKPVAAFTVDGFGMVMDVSSEREHLKSAHTTARE